MTAKRTPAPKAKPKHYTRAQNKAFRIYLRNHPQHPARHPASRRATGPASGPASGISKAIGPVVRNAAHRSPKRGAPGYERRGDWIAGGNNESPSCVAAAVANSLLAQTGIRVTDQDVLLLHEQCSTGDGVSIPRALFVVSMFGVGGHRPAAYWSGQGGVRSVNGLIVGVTDGFSDHAVTWTDQGLISWGAPLSRELENEWPLDGEAWFIDWRGEVH